MPSRDGSEEKGGSLFQFPCRVKEAVRNGVAGPEWVRVEIQELRERNDSGDVLAKCEAITA